MGLQGGWWRVVVGWATPAETRSNRGVGGVRPVGSGHWSYLVRAVWRPPALGPHTGLGACCSRRHGGRDVTIVSREHVWQDSTDLTSGHATLISRPRRRSSRRWRRPSRPPWSMGATTPGHHHATHPGTTHDGGLSALRPPPVDLVEVRPHLATYQHSPGDHDLTPTTHHGAFGAPFAPPATQHALV